MSRRVARLKEIEHEADIITHRTYEKMHTTFLTPLDREDIYCLVNKMDSILDMTEAAAARLFLYRVKEPAEGAHRTGEGTQRVDRKGQNDHPRPQGYEKRLSDPPDQR